MMQDRIFFKNLDPIRFIAAMMVFIEHGFVPAFTLLELEGTVWERVMDIVGDGEMGVSIFFVLSGFLITWLLVSEHEQAGGIKIWKFYLRRLLRIWPLYFLFTLVAFGIIPFFISYIGEWNPPGASIWYQLAFLSNFDAMMHQNAMEGPFFLPQAICWSISIEEQFYILWPLIFLLPRKSWIYIVGFILVLSLAFRLYYIDEHHVLYFHSFAIFLDLAMGGMFALMCKRFSSVLSFFQTRGDVWQILLFAITALLLFIGRETLLGDFGPALGRLFTSFLFGLIIASQAFKQKSSFMDLSNIPIANYWGKRTYGLYLWHSIALVVIGWTIDYLNIDYRTVLIPNLLWGIAGLFLSLILTWFSYKYFELWFLQFKRRFQVVRNRE